MKKKGRKTKKKIGADTEMGYCPFEHKAGLGAQAGAADSRAGRSRRAGAGAYGCGSRRGAREARRPGRGLGVLLGQQAVHSLHSTCFDPVSTQYCS